MIILNKIITIFLVISCGLSMACGNEKVRQCVEYLNTSVENTKEHKIKMEAWKTFEKEKEKLKKQGKEINDDVQNNMKELKIFLEALNKESNTQEAKERKSIQERTKQMLQKPNKSTKEIKAIQLSTMAIAQAINAEQQELQLRNRVLNNQEKDKQLTHKWVNALAEKHEKDNLALYVVYCNLINLD